MIKKYSIGILLIFAILIVNMLYNFQWCEQISGTKGINAENFFLTRIFIWLYLGLLFLYVKQVEKGSFLLWKDIKYPFFKAVLYGFSVYLVAVFGASVLNFVIQKFSHEHQSSMLLEMVKIFKNQIPLIIFTCVTAGITEELIFRGYIQTRLEKIYKSPNFAIVVSSLLFGILHSTYGTISQVVGPFFIGLVFAVFYKKYSNIKILMVAHFLIDFISLMLMQIHHFKH